MTSLAGVKPEQVNEVTNYLLARIIAVIYILEKKGLLKGIDIEAEINRATAFLDQEITRQKEERLTKWKEENPEEFKQYEALKSIMESLTAPIEGEEDE